MSWAAGHDRVAALVAAGELERVAADPALARRLLADGVKHIESAQSAAGLGDLTGAYQLAYDSLRKAAAALMAAQGLRATTRGGHIAIQDTVQSQFAGTGTPFRSFGRIRRNGNSYEYPDSDEAGPDGADVDDAVAVALSAVTAAEALLDSGRLGPWA